jgi:hypothetical protein
VGNPEGKRLLGRTRHRWLEKIRMDLLELGWSDVDCIGLTQDRNRWRALVNSVLNLKLALLPLSSKSMNTSLSLIPLDGVNFHDKTTHIIVLVKVYL